MGNPKYCPLCRHIPAVAENIPLLCPSCRESVEGLRREVIYKRRENEIKIYKESIKERQIPHTFKKFRGYNNKMKES